MVDIIIVAIVVVATLIGVKKGFTVCIVNIFSLIIALAVAFALCKPVAGAIMQKTAVDETIQNTVKNEIPMGNQDINVTVDSNLPEGIKNYINGATQNINDTKDQAIDNASAEISKQVITVVAFVVIFIIVKLILSLIKILSKIINKLPVLKQVDKIGGLVCGALEGILIVYFAFAIISLISPTMQGGKLLENINNSYLGKQMYNNNLIINKIYNK